MKIYSLIALSFIAGFIACSLFTCDREPVPNNNLAELDAKSNFQEQKIKHLEAKITKGENLIDSLKKCKGKVIYRTKFDTLATIDTVIVELIHCDSVVQIDAKIITAQDSVIYDQSQIIKAQDTLISVKDTLILEEKSDHNATKKELKKAKKKLFFTKVCTIAIIAGVIVLIAL